MPTPRSIGRYQVSRLLGEGAMGRVYLANDPELGREVAIKVLRLDAAGSARDAYIARFRNEARAAARFMHPNVVAVYDAGVDPALGPYLVYEYVSGRTLRGRIAEGRLDTLELVTLARGIGSALDALHAAGIIHRDIKPDNILLAPDGAVKLTDFGIARVPDAALTRDGQFLGTPAYAAPEAITRGDYSARGDVFSFAAVLYESLCGIRPFPGEDAVAVSYAVANDTPPPPSRFVPGLPRGVDEAFARAFAKRAHDRIASAGELAGMLYTAYRAAGATASASATTALATQPMPPRRPQHPSVQPKPAPPGARSIAPALLVAVILTALAFVLATRFRNGGDEPGEAPASARQPARGGESSGAPAAPRAPSTTTRGASPARGRAGGTAAGSPNTAPRVRGESSASPR